MAASEKKGVSVVSRGKTLLRNVIRHTDWHNRMLEEAEMWNQYSKAKKGDLNETEIDGRSGRKEKYECRSKDSSRRSEPYKDGSDVQKSFLYDDREPVSSTSNSSYNKSLRRPMRSAHMDVGRGNNGVSGTGTNDGQNNGDTTTFWMRQLYKAEEGDEDRWGHTGFKELYPKVFQSDRSDTSSGDSSDSSSSSSSSSSDSEEKSSSRSSSSRKRKKRKMASVTSTKGTSSRKRNKRKEEKIRKKEDDRDGKEKKRGKEDSGRGGSCDDDDEEEKEKKKRRDSSDRRSIKRKRRRGGGMDGGSSDNNSGDDEREERKTKKKSRKSTGKERERKSKKRKKKLKK